MFLVLSCNCLYPICCRQVLSREWRCSWSSADRRCSNYIWVINNLIAYWSATYIRDLTVINTRPSYLTSWSIKKTDQFCFGSSHDTKHATSRYDSPNRYDKDISDMTVSPGVNESRWNNINGEQKIYGHTTRCLYTWEISFAPARSYKIQIYCRYICIVISYAWAQQYKIHQHGIIWVGSC